MDITSRYLHIGCDDSAPKRVREWLQNITRTLPGHVATDVELLTHELVTNAVRHSNSADLWVTVLLLPEAIQIEVSDQGGSGEPVVRRSVDPYSAHGRGLRWVDELSDLWGAERRNATSVWFQVMLPDEVRPGALRA